MQGMLREKVFSFLFSAMQTAGTEYSFFFSVYRPILAGDVEGDGYSYLSSISRADVLLLSAKKVCLLLLSLSLI
jgi:hypothetical protein